MTVALFTLGGTISMAGSASGGPGVVSRLTGADLAAAVPGLADVGPVEVHDVQGVPSAALTFATVLEVVAAASRAVEDGATGVVLTQGTDTMEETAWLVDLVWPHPEPFVVTGAMRNPTMAGTDGPANLLAAVQVATSVSARDLGAVVVFADEVHAARWVRKQHSTSTGTFGSPNAGPLGHLVEGAPRILTRPARLDPLGRPAPERWAAARVALHASTCSAGAWSTAGCSTRSRRGCCCGCCWRSEPTAGGSPRRSPAAADRPVPGAVTIVPVPDLRRVPRVG